MIRIQNMADKRSMLTPEDKKKISKKKKDKKTSHLFEELFSSEKINIDPISDASKELILQKL